MEPEFDFEIYTLARHSCAGKIRYGSAVAATRAAYHLEEERAGRETFDVYPCRHCPFYHTGHRRRPWGAPRPGR